MLNKQMAHDWTRLHYIIPERLTLRIMTLRKFCIVLSWRLVTARSTATICLSNQTWPMNTFSILVGWISLRLYVSNFYIYINIQYKSPTSVPKVMTSTVLLKSCNENMPLTTLTLYTNGFVRKSGTKKSVLLSLFLIFACYLLRQQFWRASLRFTLGFSET